MRKKPETIDQYLASVTEPKRKALQRLRRTIRKLLPKGVECISYGLPAFRLGNGPVVAGFQATSKGCSYYPFSGSTLPALAAHLSGYSRTRSALHFAADKPLPVALVRKLLKTRIAETKV